ncbi:MAG: sugar phosphate isomerase/epimerase [Clostridia bacterium]|nr:sugar phosphate isomerase/epimerase [Clostridia bacterium]
MNITNYNLFRSDLYQNGLAYAAEHSARLGFDSVEMLVLLNSQKPPLLDVINPQETRRILEHFGQSVACYSVAAQLYTEDVHAVEETLCRNAELAAALGSPYFHHTLLLGSPPNAPTYDEVFDGIVASAERVAKYCNSLGLTALYEPQGKYFNGIDGLGRFYKELKSRGLQVGICNDLGNSLFADVSPTEVTQVFATEVKHVHIKDYIMASEPFADQKCWKTVKGNWFAECEIGHGVVDHRACFDILRRADYEGAISLEIEGNDETMLSAIAYVKSLLQ